MRITHRAVTLCTVFFVSLSMSAGVHGQMIFSDEGFDAAAITPTVDAFRTVLGILNAPDPVNQPAGRRQINWDAAPDSVSAANEFPGNFFNANFSPRARGIEFAADGGLQLSATAASGVGIEFANINPQYDELFEPFSQERLFAPVESNSTFVEFFSPADPSTPATTRGLGVVFSDVDLAGTTLELFDVNDNSLGIFDVPEFGSGGATAPEGVANEHFSFLGVAFDDPVIATARIRTGSTALGPNEDLANDVDLVVMDDFIFGEPVPVPEPVSSGAWLIAVAWLGLRKGDDS